MTEGVNGLDRRAIEISGFGHGGQPIPAAARKGPLIITGGVSGIDRATGDYSSDAREQIERMFDNLAAIMAAADASLDDVVKVSVKLLGNEARAALNDVWVARFPDAATRPARHTTMADALPGKMLVQCEAIAFAG